MNVRDEQFWEIIPFCKTMNFETEGFLELFLGKNFQREINLPVVFHFEANL